MAVAHLEQFRHEACQAWRVWDVQQTSENNAVPRTGQVASHSMPACRNHCSYSGLPEGQAQASRSHVTKHTAPQCVQSKKMSLYLGGLLAQREPFLPGVPTGGLDQPQGGLLGVRRHAGRSFCQGRRVADVESFTGCLHSDPSSPSCTLTQPAMSSRVCSYQSLWLVPVCAQASMQSHSILLLFTDLGLQCLTRDRLVV